MQITLAPHRTTLVRTAAPAAPAPSADERLLLDRMRADETLDRIRVLAAAPRVWGTPGYDAAAAYVVDALRAAGWDVRMEELRASNGRALHNVVAERRGTAPDAERGLVVAGAHLDSVRGAPGANDNASGSATLVELAEAFADVPTRNDVRLVWFDGEEAGLLGSRAHVRANAADAARTIAMLNMDMVGSQFGDVGVSLGARTSTAVGDAAKAVALRTGVSGFVRTERHSRSDHASFDAAGIPALDFGVSVRSIDRDDPNYHSPRDTIERINRDVLEGYGDLIATTLLDFANRDERIPGAPPRDIDVIDGPPK